MLAALVRNEGGDRLQTLSLGGLRVRVVRVQSDGLLGPDFLSLDLEGSRSRLRIFIGKTDCFLGVLDKF